MSDWYQQVRENLENRPLPPFEEDAWQDMECRLNNIDKDSSKGIGWWWPAVMVALLLPLGFNFWLFQQREKTQQLISNTTLPPDTIINQQLIIKTDTIYQIRIIHQTVVEHETIPAVFSQEIVTAKHPHFYRPFSGTPDFKEISSSFDKGLLNISIPSSPTIFSIIPSSIYSINKRDQIAKLGLLPIKAYKKEKSFNLGNALRPKGLQLGITGGWVNPFYEDLNPQSGYGLGIEAIIEFSGHLQMWLNAAYLNLQFEFERMDPSIGIPAVSPPTDDFAFANATVRQSSVQYSVGMQYFFNSSSKWKPFLGIGFASVSILHYEIHYEFENNLLDINWVLQEEVDQNSFLNNFLLLKVGVQHQLSQNLNWQLQMTYRTNWKELGLSAPNLFSLQTGLAYHF